MGLIHTGTPVHQADSGSSDRYQICGSFRRYVVTDYCTGLTMTNGKLTTLGTAAQLEDQLTQRGDGYRRIIQAKRKKWTGTNPIDCAGPAWKTYALLVVCPHCVANGKSSVMVGSRISDTTRRWRAAVLLGAASSLPCSIINHEHMMGCHENPIWGRHSISRISGTSGQGRKSGSHGRSGAHQRLCRGAGNR